MRIIIYGYGKIFKNEYSQLDKIELVAIADKKAMEIKVEEKELCQLPLILPNRIRDYSYDYVAISSKGMFESIKQQLICENGILPERIISMQLLKKKEFKKLIEESEEDFLKDELDPKVRVCCDALTEKENYAFLENGYRRMSSVFYDVFLPDKKETFEKDFFLYVITHKEYGYQLHPGYCPICVGGYSSVGALTDQSGENVSDFNNRINEMTAIYWVWKNKPSKYVGFCHYRRYFYDNNFGSYENHLKATTALEYLNKYDMLVCEKSIDADYSIEYELKMPLSDEAFECGYNIILSNIRKHQPEYEKDFYEVLSGKTLCYYNMFVTTWEVFDRFATWLFSFLIPAAEEFPIERFEGQDKRTIGFFAERMLSVWLRQNPLTLKSLPAYIP